MINVCGIFLGYYLVNMVNFKYIVYHNTAQMDLVRRNAQSVTCYQNVQIRLHIQVVLSAHL